MVAISEGAGLASGEHLATTQTDIHQLAKCYMARHAMVHKKPASIAMDQRLLEKVILPGLGGLMVGKVSLEDIQRLHSAQWEYPVKANRVLALLSKMFNLAEDWGLRPLGSNPVSRVQRHPEKGRHWVATADDYVRLWRALGKAESEGKVLPTLPLAVKLLMLLGCSKKEALSLQWSQVMLDKRYVRFTNLNGRSRMVALPQAAIAALRAAPRMEDNPFVCWGNKSGSHLVGINRFFKHTVKEAGLDNGLRIQDLRHLYPASSHWLSLI